MRASFFGFAFLAASCVFAQPSAPLAYEIASIKPNDSGDGSSSSHSSKGEMIMRNVSLKQIVQMAYDVKDYSMSGPDWLSAMRFDINAKTPAEAAEEKDPLKQRAQTQAMLQSLLADRFKLKIHYESKTMNAYALIIAKGGLKVKPVEPGGGSSTNTNNGRLTATKISMERFADWLARRVDRPVVDKTETKGVFDIKMEFSPELGLSATAPGEPARVPDNPAAGPTIYTALQEQVGLKLQGQKLPVDVLVVDHIERVPTEN